MVTVKKTVAHERFVKFLDDMMEKKGLSVRKLAEKAGMSPSYLSHLKRYKNNIPSNEKLYKLADVLEIGHDRILLEAGRIPGDDDKLLGLMRTAGELSDDAKALALEVIKEFVKVQETGTDE